MKSQLAARLKETGNLLLDTCSKAHELSEQELRAAVGKVSSGLLKCGVVMRPGVMVVPQYGTTMPSDTHQGLNDESGALGLDLESASRRLDEVERQWPSVESSKSPFSSLKRPLEAIGNAFLEIAELVESAWGISGSTPRAAAVLEARAKDLLRRFEAVHEELRGLEAAVGLALRGARG